ncbi:MAG: Mur ligase family protein [Candidatus Hydrogenedentes bacterium]|nr:Mur ligase family protein [Candidatus Hydrogenedentota bacterium]
MSKIHFSGIGGTAMLGGAFLALQLGHEIRGSDGELYPPTSVLVERLNSHIYKGYSKSNLDWAPDYVIIGNALSRGNPEVEEVLNRRISFFSLPEWLRLNILSRRKSIVVSGTHGKTTTTSLIAWILKFCGFDPGYLVGGYPKNFEKPAELGRDNSFFVIEGDEYDTAFFDKRAKFFHYLPYLLIVTSLEFDHGDIYSSLEEIEKAFGLLLRLVPSDGYVFLCGDNNAFSLKDKAFSKVQLYGCSERNDWVVKADGQDLGKRQFRRLSIYWKGKKEIEVDTSLSGKHNALNILVAVALSKYLSISNNAISEAIRSFRGVGRRQEVFLEIPERNVVYIDDFAHHPTAIKETIIGLRERYPNKRILAIFEPRSNTSVTNIMQEEYQESFSYADEVIIGPIHREEKIPENLKLDRQSIVNYLLKNGIKAVYTNDFSYILEYITSDDVKDAVVLLMSNGACGNLRERIISLYNASNP